MSQDKNINSLLALSRMEQIMVSMEFQIVTFIMCNHGNWLHKCGRRAFPDCQKYGVIADLIIHRPVNFNYGKTAMKTKAG